MRTLYWGRVWAQTDIGEGWIHAKVRPPWFWFFMRLKLWALIVWRIYDEQDGWRIDAATAWDVSQAAIGLTAPVPIHPGPLPADDDAEGKG